MSYGSGRGWQALGAGLSGIGQTLRQKKEQDALAAERQGDRDLAQQRYRDGLLSTPGFYSAPETDERTVFGGTGLPEFQNPTQAPPPRPPLLGAATHGLPPIEAPDFSQDFKVQDKSVLAPGHTRMSSAPDIAFNPNHQQEQAAAERQRRLDAALAARRAPDSPQSQALADVEGFDLTYRGPTSQQGMLNEQRAITGIQTAGQRDVLMAPRWQPPPEPTRPQLVQTPDGPKWVTPPDLAPGTVQDAGFKPLPAPGDTPSRMLPSWSDVRQMVQGSRQYRDATPAEQFAAIGRIMNGSEPMPAEPTEPPAGGGGWLSGIGDILRAGSIGSRAHTNPSSLAPGRSAPSVPGDSVGGMGGGGMLPQAAPPEIAPGAGQGMGPSFDNSDEAFVRDGIIQGKSDTEIAEALRRKHGGR